MIMDILSLNDLLTSVMAAVTEANYALGNHYVNTLSQHFNYNQDQKQWEPETMTMLLPKQVLHEGENPEQPVDVPTAALAGNNALLIDNLKIDFGCILQQISQDSEGNKTMMVSMSSPVSGTLDNKINISMVIRSGEPSEGASRLRDALVRKI
jgi:hypothetical protein